MVEAQEPKTSPNESFRTLVISAFAVVCFVAICAIILSLYLLQQNQQNQAVTACRIRISTYAAELSEDISTQGWDTLVARAQGDTSKDVQTIAREMRQRIDELKGRARGLRANQTQICMKDPNFQPR